MVKVGIICAGDSELEPFLPHIQKHVASKKAMLTFHEGTIQEVPVVALYSGVCKTNAAIAAQILIDAYGVGAIINAGTAGAISGNLDILDTVIATEAAHHDMDKGILTEFHPWMPSVFFKSDETLLALSRRAVEKLPSARKISFGRMVTGEKFIDHDGRDEIIATFHPLSVDNETASVAQVCYANGIPFIAVRTITDTAAHSGVDNFNKYCDAASEIAKEVVLALLKEMEK